MGGRKLGDEGSTSWSPRTSKGPQADLSSREGQPGAPLPLLPGTLLALRGAGSAIYPLRAGSQGGQGAPRLCQGPVWGARPAPSWDQKQVLLRV